MSVSGSSLFPVPPSLIEWTNFNGQKLSFLIMNSPKDENIDFYVNSCKKYNAKRMVRASDKTYSEGHFIDEGIGVNSLEFDEISGQPPTDIVDDWLKIVSSTFGIRKRSFVSLRKKKIKDVPSIGPTIAIHCVTGLGRAPMLVAIALIENGMDMFDAVQLIREKRYGAISDKQIVLLNQYRCHRMKRCSSCSIM
mmetsp:Transcript_270/g.419  ORF Transcript_270/g.419 Transcript_270/m.419 type:complete len:194 (-) Transcript_270:56-637(-)|eukprot:CAMPEP_0171454954 /NCGR_PEP_ID=MMETSP0945-20130129/2040_1 /TAXON_ID=109269 /ORGANISM="Vaucheria litorea, Strain CCMP2940" /LENGTH=193 /DNA_ID=CAMNT_0011980093 /DNA_START=225 /DNA_END=806 /DNA_ORIENTATION=-